MKILIFIAKYNKLISLFFMYNETVMEHFQNPRNTGEIENPDGIGKVGNPNCGDVMMLYIKVDDGKLCEMKYKTFGCAAAIATSSAATELVLGKTLEEAENLSREDIVEYLNGLPAEKIACSTIAPDAIRRRCTGGAQRRADRSLVECGSPADR